MKGIDISSHNGSIDFNQVKNDGVQVVIIKATEGVDFVDSYLEEHYRNTCGKGLAIGFYHFMSERTNPSQQAEDFYNAIKDKEYNVLPCLDIETNNQGRSTTEITDRCLEFLNKFKELSGLDCMIYTGGYFGRDNLDDRIKNYPAWIAHYGVDTPMSTGFVNIVGHQYTEEGSIGGVNTDCDVNNFNEGVFINGASINTNVNIAQPTQSPVQKAKEFVGSRCLELQQKLNQAFNYGLAEDNDFRQLTYTALGDAQTSLGITCDYLAGDKTFEALDNYIDSMNKSTVSDNWVLQLQEELNNQGYTDENGNRLVEDSMGGKLTLSACPTLRQGSQGGITRLLQIRIGAYSDSYFGKRTSSILSTWQIQNGLVGDSICGKLSWSKLLGLS